MYQGSSINPLSEADHLCLTILLRNYPTSHTDSNNRKVVPFKIENLNHSCGDKHSILCVEKLLLDHHNTLD